jgi:hypothetical protein
MEWEGFGKTLIVIGLVTAFMGLIVMLAGRWPGGTPFTWLGRLPGDILIKRDNFSFYFPLATSVLISIVLSLVVMVISLLSKH